jgi:hypothetical protein
MTKEKFAPKVPTAQQLDEWISKGLKVRAGKMLDMSSDEPETVEGTLHYYGYGNFEVHSDDGRHHKVYRAEIELIPEKETAATPHVSFSKEEHECLKNIVDAAIPSWCRSSLVAQVEAELDFGVAEFLVKIGLLPEVINTETLPRLSPETPQRPSQRDLEALKEGDIITFETSEVDTTLRRIISGTIVEVLDPISDDEYSVKVRTLYCRDNAFSEPDPNEDDLWEVFLDDVLSIVTVDHTLLVQD